MSWLKWVGFGFLAVVLMVFVYFMFSEQESNVRATQEVKDALKTAEIGLLRDQGNVQMDKRDFVANLALDVVKTQKNNGRDIRIDYAFLNDKGEITEEDSEITGAQFRIQLLDKKHRVVSQTIQRISLKGE